jgi:hypothetical protein
MQTAAAVVVLVQSAVLLVLVQVARAAQEAHRQLLELQSQEQAAVVEQELAQAQAVAQVAAVLVIKQILHQIQEPLIQAQAAAPKTAPVALVGTVSAVQAAQAWSLLPILTHLQN